MFSRMINWLTLICEADACDHYEIIFQNSGHVNHFDLSVPGVSAFHHIWCVTIPPTVWIGQTKWIVSLFSLLIGTF